MGDDVMTVKGHNLYLVIILCTCSICTLSTLPRCWLAVGRIFTSSGVFQKPRLKTKKPNVRTGNKCCTNARLLEPLLVALRGKLTRIALTTRSNSSSIFRVTLLQVLSDNPMSNAFAYARHYSLPLAIMSNTESETRYAWRLVVGFCV